MPHLRCLLALSLLIGLVESLQAQPREWPVPRGPSREPEFVTYDPGILKNVPDDYLKNYPGCYLRAASWYLIEEDGTVECTTHEIVRLNNRKGIDQLGEHRNVTFRPDQERLTLNEARVHKPDGTRIVVEPKHVQVRDVTTDYYVYDSTKELIISFPGLEPGDVIETKWTTRGKNPEYAGRYFTRYQFGDERCPVWQETLGVRIPKGKTLKYAPINAHLMPNSKVEPEITEKDGRKLFVWRGKDRLPVPKEESLPSKEELRPGVAFSTFASWEEVADWERKIRTNCWECNVDLKKIVEQVKRGHKAPEDVARELTYWVRRHIRYVSSGDKHDFTPHEPEHIHRNRYGDCKDGVQLLAVLLKEAGIPAQQISLNVVGDGQVMKEVPSPLTTHAILLTTINGKDHWIDTTASHAGWDFLPKSDRDRVAYAVDDTTFRILRTPKALAEENRADATTWMWIKLDGTSRNVRESTWYGEAALAKRDEWVDASDVERRRLIRADLLEGNSKVKLAEKLGIDEQALRRWQDPVKATIEFDIAKQFQGTGELEGSVADNSLWSRLLGVSVDSERTLPIELKEQFESRQTFVIEAPPGYRLGSAPENRKYTSKWGAFHRTIEVAESGRKWTVIFLTKIDKTRIELDEFEAFLDFQERVSSAHRVYLTMKPSESANDLKADIQIAEKAFEKEPKKLAPALELVNLHLRAGNKEMAVKIVRAALVTHPGNRKLLELFAQSSDEPKEIESAYRELIKQFPNEPRYHLELARVLADASETAKARELLQPLTKCEVASIKADSCVLLAELSLEDNDAAKALDFINEAKLADTEIATNVDALRLEGEACELLKKDAESAAAYKKALALDPKDPDTLECLVRLSFRKNEKAEALQYLRSYVANIANGGSCATAADWFLKLGRLEEAEEMLRREPSTNAGSLGCQVKGLLCFRQGKWDEAVQTLGKSASRPETLHALVVSNLMLGRLSEAIERLQQSKIPAKSSVDLEKDAAAVRYLKSRRDAIGAANKKIVKEAVEQFVCAEYLYSLGRPGAEVQVLLAKALADRAEFGEAYGLFAELLVERAQLTKALSCADKAINLAPLDARGWFVRGRVRLEREQREALGDLRKAVELSGEANAQMLHWLATGLIRERQFDAARKAEMKAIQLRPDDLEIKEQLRQIEDVLSRK